MYKPVFVVGANPQLRLLAEFLAVMANTNEEATFRVFDDLKIRCTPGTVRVIGPFGVTDAWVENVEECLGETFPTPNEQERQEMLMDILNKIKGA